MLDNDDYFAGLVFSSPIDDETWRTLSQSVIDGHSNSYLPADGTTEEMSVELRRRKGDREYRV